jgi:transposase
MGRAAVSLSQRAQALALLEENVPVSRIMERTHLSKSTIFRIREKAVERGYDRASNPVFQDDFFRDNPRSGRPRLLGEEEIGMTFFPHPYACIRSFRSFCSFQNILRFP